MMKKFFTPILIALIIIINVGRFIALEESPPGFYIDESAGATQIICLRETGSDPDGKSFPVFSRAAGFGLYPPLLFFGAIWTKFFGDSISSFRSIAGIFTVFTIVGLYLLSQLFMGQRAAFFIVLAASVSPWAFHFSRIAWDPPLAPCFLIWAVYFFYKTKQQKDLIISGILFALAMYSYPPVRVVVPLLLIPMFWIKKKRGEFSYISLISFFVPLLILIYPIIEGTLIGEIMSRYRAGNIFQDRYLRTFGEPSFFLLIKVFIRDYFSHFSPSYLLLKGDGIRRHSIQTFGEWSWLDVFSLASGACICVYLILKKSFSSLKSVNPLLSLAFYGYFVAIIPSVIAPPSPHALHSIAGWPFLSIIVGFTLFKAEQYFKFILPAITLISLLFTGMYFRSYFYNYPKFSGPYFESQIKDMAIKAQVTDNWEGFSDTYKNYHPLSRHYFLMRYKKDKCRSTY